MNFYWKHLAIGLIFPLAIASFSACSSDDDDKPEDLTQASMEGDPFVYVQESDGSNSVFDTHDVELDMVFNRIKRTAKFDFRNVNYGEGPKNFSFSNVDYGLGSDGISYSISNPDLKADGALAGKSLGLYALFSGEKLIDDEECVGVGARVSINGQKDITLIPRELLWHGTTETRLTTVQDSVYVSYETIYKVKINPAASTAQIIVHKPKFAAAMPTLDDMVFSDIKVNYKPGGFILEAEQLIPSIADTPYPRYVITNLKADCDLLSPESSLEFNCMGVFKVTASIHSNFAD